MNEPNPSSLYFGPTWANAARRNYLNLPTNTKNSEFQGYLQTQGDRGQWNQEATNKYYNINNLQVSSKNLSQVIFKSALQEIQLHIPVRRPILSMQDVAFTKYQNGNGMLGTGQDYMQFNEYGTMKVPFYNYDPATGTFGNNTSNDINISEKLPYGATNYLPISNKFSTQYLLSLQKKALKQSRALGLKDQALTKEGNKLLRDIANKINPGQETYNRRNDLYIHDSTLPITNLHADNVNNFIEHYHTNIPVAPGTGGGGPSHHYHYHHHPPGGGGGVGPGDTGDDGSDVNPPYFRPAEDTRGSFPAARTHAGGPVDQPPINVGGVSTPRRQIINGILLPPGSTSSQPRVEESGMTNHGTILPPSHKSTRGSLRGTPNTSVATEVNQTRMSGNNSRNTSGGNATPRVRFNENPNETVHASRLDELLKEDKSSREYDQLVELGRKRAIARERLDTSDTPERQQRINSLREKLSQNNLRDNSEDTINLTTASIQNPMTPFTERRDISTIDSERTVQDMTREDEFDRHVFSGDATPSQNNSSGSEIVQISLGHIEKEIESSLNERGVSEENRAAMQIVSNILSDFSREGQTLEQRAMAANYLAEFMVDDLHLPSSVRERVNEIVARIGTENYLIPVSSLTPGVNYNAAQQPSMLNASNQSAGKHLSAFYDANNPRDMMMLEEIEKARENRREGRKIIDEMDEERKKSRKESEDVRKESDRVVKKSNEILKNSKHLYTRADEWKKKMAEDTHREHVNRMEDMILLNQVATARRTGLSLGTIQSRMSDLSNLHGSTGNPMDASYTEGLSMIHFPDNPLTENLADLQSNRDRGITKSMQKELSKRNKKILREKHKLDI